MRRTTDNVAAQTFDAATTLPRSPFSKGFDAVRKRLGIHRVDRRARLAPSRLRGCRQLRRRGTRGYADCIDVTLRADGGVNDDNGRGIPVDEHPVEHRPAVEVVLATTLHAGGKFGGSSYAVSGGLHGVGVSVVNALSSRPTIEIRREELT